MNNDQEVCRIVTCAIKGMRKIAGSTLCCSQSIVVLLVIDFIGATTLSVASIDGAA